MKLNNFKKMIIAAALMGAAASSQASLIPVGEIPTEGSGFGNVNTVLTLASDNQTGVSSGAVIRMDGADQTTGNTKPGESANSTYSFDFLGVDDATDLLFVFNPNEPAGNSITLDSLVLSIYSDMGGTALFTATLEAPLFFESTNQGTGKAGFGFALDAEQAAMAQQFISATNRIGLSAGVSSATGGPDTFFVMVREDEGEGPGNEIPEPGSIALLGLGIAGLWAVRRRKA